MKVLKSLHVCSLPCQLSAPPQRQRRTRAQAFMQEGAPRTAGKEVGLSRREGLIAALGCWPVLWWTATNAEAREERTGNPKGPSPDVPPIAAPPKGPSNFTITVVPKEDSARIKFQYESMQWQCTGGMFDCDGDRRDFAQKQVESFAKKLAPPKK